MAGRVLVPAWEELRYGGIRAPSSHLMKSLVVMGAWAWLA
jgi:hypothetical protein